MTPINAKIIYDNESCIIFSKYSPFIKSKQVKNINYEEYIYLYIINFLVIFPKNKVMQIVLKIKKMPIKEIT